MDEHMPDSQLNGAEWAVQQLFRKLLNFNMLSVGLATLAGYGAIRELPAIPARPARSLAVQFAPMSLPTEHTAFTVHGAWKVVVDDRRVQGLSGLTIAGDKAVAISDLGAAIRFSLPGTAHPSADIIDLRDGPGSFGSKKNRDAEAIAADGAGGWLVAFENRHSVWRYDHRFQSGSRWAGIDRSDWRANGGVEALIQGTDGPIAFVQTGTEMLTWHAGGWRSTALALGWQVADAAQAPDGSTWLLLRSVKFGGFDGAIAPLLAQGNTYRLGPIDRFPQRAADNFEGMAIAPIPGGYRFWLVSDDGHYLWPRTILMALDLPRTQENARR